jgi:CO dehydrogenase/acetyl-CoA synthase alpha subunit
LALVAGRSTGASEAAAFVAAALIVSAAAAAVVASIVRIGASSSRRGPKCSTIADFVLMAVGAVGVALTLWTRSRR